jgi:DNA-binding protein, histone-like, putative
MQTYVVRPKVDKSSGEEKTMYYGIPLSAGIIDEEYLANEISERCSLTPADVLATINALSQSMQDHLCCGETIRLKGIGLFTVSASSEGVGAPEECTPSKLKPQRICFRADKILKSVLGRIKYKMKKTGK